MGIKQNKMNDCSRKATPAELAVTLYLRLAPLTHNYYLQTSDFRKNSGRPKNFEQTLQPIHFVSNNTHAHAQRLSVYREYNAVYTIQ